MDAWGDGWLQRHSPQCCGGPKKEKEKVEVIVDGCPKRERSRDRERAEERGTNHRCRCHQGHFQLIRHSWNHLLLFGCFAPVSSRRCSGLGLGVSRTSSWLLPAIPAGIAGR
eukprot:2850347-Rhodomonas_salina.2